MLEVGKMEECRAKDMSSYQSPRKAETGLGSDRLPWEPREFTPASKDGLREPSRPEIIPSIDEAGRGYRTCPVVVHILHEKHDSIISIHTIPP